MKRRSFLQIAAVAGAASVNLEKLSATAAATVAGEQSGLTAEEIAAPPKVIQALQNEYLDVAIYSDATTKINDLKNGASWRMGPVAFQDDSPIEEGAVWVRTERSICEQYPGRFSGRREGDALRFVLLDRLRAKRGTFRATATLHGPWLQFRISDIDESIPNLSFPPPLESETLVIPQGVGRWIRKPVSGRHYLPFFSRLNMRWFGGTNEGNSWMALFPEKNLVDSGAMLAELSAFPVWLKSLERWSEPRVVRYTFLRGGYAELAKTYREWAITHGLHKPLKEKVVETPALANLLEGRLISVYAAAARHQKSYREDILQNLADDDLIGSTPKVFFTNKDVEKILDELPETGIHRALVVHRGWIYGGYDYSHPDVWPPDPALGKVEELAAICGHGDPYTVGLHDNYQDIYAHCASFPNGVNHSVKRELLAGGYWGGGQAYILNSRDGVAYAKRNWGHIKTVRPRAMFIDTTSAVQCYESFEKGNTLTRTQDVQCKQELLQFFKAQGMVLGSEEGADFAIPYLDWLENRHARVAGESVPLWPLVFHDAAACGRYVNDEDDAGTWMGGAIEGRGYPTVLEDMLWGYFVLSGLKDMPSWPKQKETLKSTAYADEWFRSISMAAMTEHRYLAPDNSVEQTAFSNGRSIIVNFSKKTWKQGAAEVAAKSFAITG
jgi:hypothetical protein